MRWFACGLICVSACFFMLTRPAFYKNPVDQQANTKPLQETTYNYPMDEGAEYIAVSASGPAPSHGERQEMAAGVLAILNKNITAGTLDYRFNSSGDGVVLSTAGLAFIATGSSLESGPYRQALTQVYAKLKAIMTSNSFDLQPTWGCAASCIFLAELHRVSLGKERSSVLKLLNQYAQKLIAAQTPEGAWCHGFENVANSLGYSNFMFVTGMATHGLALARREGVPVSDEVLNKAFSYCEDSSNVGSGFIGYSPRRGQKGMKGPGRTAGGLLALQAAGKENETLYQNAAKYVRSSFDVHTGSRPQDLLVSGHASAQIGIAWAAWWAAESGYYDEFWKGQGVAIAGRKKADGGFRPAPTDGNESGGTSESGDFSNAFHALMLVADYGGLSNGTVNRSDPVRSIFLAQRCVTQAEEAQHELPESVGALAAIPVQYGAFDRRPLYEAIELAAAELIENGGEWGLQQVPALINGGFKAKMYVDAKGKKSAIFLEGNKVFVTRDIKVEIEVLNDSGIFKKNPRRTKVRLSKKKTYAKKLTEKLLPEVALPETITMHVHWLLGEKTYTETVSLPVIRQE